MSDQGSFGQPPTAPPQVPTAPPQVPPAPQQPPAGYAPAMPPQAAGYAPPPQTAPPKKRKTWLIIAIVAVVLVCLPAACLGAFAMSAAREQAKTQEAVALAESHFAAATDALEAASQSMGAYGEAGDAGQADEAETKIRAARDELAASRASIEPLDDSQGKSDYLASLDAANEALEGIEQLIGTLRLLSQLSSQITEGTSAIRSADGQLDDAIDAGNDSKYDRMKSKASSAASGYDKARTIFESAHKLEPDAGLDTVVSYVKLRKQQADLAVEMATDGAAGRISAYNKQVDKQKSLDTKAEKTGEPAIVTNPKWFEERVAEQQSGFEQAGERADQLRGKALEEFDYKTK